MNIVDIIISGSPLGYYLGVGFIIFGLILIFKKNWIRKAQKFQENIGTRRTFGVSMKTDKRIQIMFTIVGIIFLIAGVIISILTFLYSF